MIVADVKNTIKLTCTYHLTLVTLLKLCYWILIGLAPILGAK